MEATAVVRTNTIQVNAAVREASWRFLLVACLLSTALLTAALAVFLLVRGLAGHLEPLPMGTLAVVGIVLAAMPLAWQLAWQYLSHSRLDPRHSAWVAWTVPAVTFSLLALALSVPVGSTACLLLWLPLVLALVGGWCLRDGLRSLPRRPPGTLAIAHPELPEPLAGPLADSEQAEQRTLRWADERGERFAGRFRCHFTAGERTQFLHVVFCPPLPAVPQLGALQLDGPPCQIKVTQAFSYGSRLEVRLMSTSRVATTVVVEVTASAADG